MKKCIPAPSKVRKGADVVGSSPNARTRKPYRYRGDLRERNNATALTGKTTKPPAQKRAIHSPVAKLTHSPVARIARL